MEQMLSGSFSPGSDFSCLAVSTYGFGRRKPLHDEKSSGKSPRTPRVFIAFCCAKAMKKKQALGSGKSPPQKKSRT
jgi:hypothetical protein